MADEKAGLTNAEVALLGLLSERPKHPWQIEKDVEFREMRSWTDLSTSSIYKRLNGLERAGLVASETEIVDGRARRVYSVTKAGSEALAAQLLEMLGEPEAQKWGIDLATYNLDLLSYDEAVPALRAYRAKLVAAIECYAELEDYLRSSGCPPHRFELARRPRFLYQGEIRWIDDFIATLEEGR